jgi:hypothetical protein
VTGQAAAGKRIVYDGLNLALTQGTGIATYARVLAHVAHEIGYEVGVVYSSPQTPPKAPLAREIAFFDAPEAIKVSLAKSLLASAVDRVLYWGPVSSPLLKCRFAQPGSLAGTPIIRMAKSSPDGATRMIKAAWSV